MKGLSISKILGSVALIVFTGAVAASATGAFFSDTETSTGNTFTAGDIDLQIDNTSYVTDNAGVLVASPANTWAMSNLTNQLFFSFDDVKPGDIGEDTISIHAGTNDAYACMAADITSTPDNGINDPEGDAGDLTDGAAGGELQNFLNFSFWEDDGDNVYETGEVLLPDLQGSAATIFDGGWNTIADSGNGPALPGGSTTYVGKAWCFGTLAANGTAQDAVGVGGSPLLRGTTGFTCDGSGSNNIAQTDGITVDVSFQAVQARNNGQFTCASLSPFNGTSSLVDVSSNDLATTSGAVNGTNWFFYNDTNDTVMTINEFSGTGGVNDIVAGPGAFGAAQMTLDSGANPRYNIATTKYGNMNLADIGSMNYRIYDASGSSEVPFLHFNVDFNDTNVWQSRLVQVPTGIVEDVWTTVDALAGTWTYSGANWPAGLINPSQPGTTPKTWAQILADYPNAEMLGSPAAFFGIRVGHPGPNGEESYVDWVEVDGETTDFEI